MTLGCSCEVKPRRVNINIPPSSLSVEAIWRLQLVAAVFSVCVSIPGIIIDSCLFLIVKY